MMMRRLVVYGLLGVLGVHTFVVIDALTLGLVVPNVLAQSAEGAGTPPDEGSPDEGKEEADAPKLLSSASESETYDELITMLQQQKSVLDQRAESLDARERRLGVLRAEVDREREELERRAQQREESLSSRGPEFERLLKAYAAMEAENAAGALEALYGKEREVVVDLLLGLNPRQAGAALDALAAQSPSIAAEISHEIWRRGESKR